jgi:toxin ParE1/3/4
MQIRWSPPAANDFALIVGYIRNDNPAAAHRAAQKIYSRISSLANFPTMGVRGRVNGTRELATTPLPFIIVYRLIEQADAIVILNILHGAQCWPARE